MLRAMTKSSMQISVVAATAAALAAAIAVPVLTQAQTTPAPTAITFQESPPKVAILHATKAGHGDTVAHGDRLVTSGGLYDAAHHRLGTIGTDCTVEGATKPVFKAALLCTVSYDTAQGQIVAAGKYVLDGSAKLPIVGGSGSYTGARGTVSPGTVAKGFDDADLITLLP
jgi:hypothetical protein